MGSADLVGPKNGTGLPQIECRASGKHGVLITSFGMPFGPIDPTSDERRPHLRIFSVTRVVNEDFRVAYPDEMFGEFTSKVFSSGISIFVPDIMLS